MKRKSEIGKEGRDKSETKKRKKVNLSQYFIETGCRPQNFIDEEPSIDPLLYSSSPLSKSFTTSLPPPRYHHAAVTNELLRYFDESLHEKYDVILMNPPWEEFSRTQGLFSSGVRRIHEHSISAVSFEELRKLEVNRIAKEESFLFLWCGSTGDHFEEARICMEAWGFRRCDVITWVKTNHFAFDDDPPFSSSSSSVPKHLFLRSPNSLLLHTSEHCLVGVKGNIRNTATNIIQSNLDVDVIVDEEKVGGDLSKPKEIYHIIERFCLGKKRLYLYANDNDLRSGWLCVGEGISGSNMYIPNPILIAAKNGIATSCKNDFEGEEF